MGVHTFQLRHSTYFCHQYQPVASAIWTPVSPSVKLKLNHFLEELQTALPPQAWMAKKLTKKKQWPSRGSLVLQQSLLLEAHIIPAAIP